ncbi:hypothetical protein V8C86DRAFT_2918341 [Haematococcus lacustris]
MKRGMKSAVPALLLLALLCLSQGWSVAAQPAPRGSYKDTCGECFWVIAMPSYYCNSCRRRDGSYRKSTLSGAATCGYVSNCDGELKCTRDC